MPRTMIVTFLLFGLVTLGCAGTGHARTYTVAVTEDIPSTRAAVELLQAAYRMIGHDLRPQIAPSRRALFMAENGLVDGDLFRIEEIAATHPNLVRVPYPFLQGRVLGLLARSGKDCTDTLPDGPLIAAVRRGVIIEKMMALSLGTTPLETESYDQVEMLLDSGRVDMALISHIENMSPVNWRLWKKYQRLCQPVTHFTLFHYLHRDHAELANELADALEELDSNGTKERILKRAYEHSLSEPDVDNAHSSRY